MGAGTADLAAMEDGDLVARVAAGDRKAYAVLVDRHLDRTVAVARRLLNGSAEAEDVAQEAFLRLWRHADRFRPDQARFSTWFYRITMNLCLDRQRRPVTAPLEAAGDPPDPAEGADTRMEAETLRSAVAQAVADLPDRLRAAVTLTYDAGMSNAEAAASLGIGVKAMESLLVRARRALRSSLAGVAGRENATGGVAAGAVAAGAAAGRDRMTGGRA
ncbi:MAG: hypothetical protein RLY86_4273 [Pseudomonadota bacterium]|jgi:RNA polymerase sigma-70 factor (ECF subfamily)